MSDFIREVDEEYRRDRVMQFLQRYQVLIAIVVVAIVVGAGGWRFWTDHKVSIAEKLNDKFMAASDLARQGKTAEAQAAFAALAKDGPAGYALLSRMRAAELLATTDPEAGAKALDDVASDTAVPVAMQDVARYRGALIRIDRDDPKAFDQRYGRFAAPGGGFSNSFRELLALAAFKRQDFAAAGRYLDEIILDGGAPAALRGRAQAFRTMIGGGAATPMGRQPPPADIAPLGAPKPDARPAASAPAPTVPTPPAPAPAAPPAATAAPTPPAAAPTPANPTQKPATSGAPD